MHGGGRQAAQLLETIRNIMPDYIEGKRAVIEALRAQMPIKCVLMADNLQQDGQVKDILRKARQFDVPVKTIRAASSTS